MLAHVSTERKFVTFYLIKHKNLLHQLIVFFRYGWQLTTAAFRPPTSAQLRSTSRPREPTHSAPRCVRTRPLGSALCLDRPRPRADTPADTRTRSLAFSAAAGTLSTARLARGRLGSALSSPHSGGPGGAASRSATEPHQHHARSRSSTPVHTIPGPCGAGPAGIVETVCIFF